MSSKRRQLANDHVHYISCTIKFQLYIIFLLYGIVLLTVVSVLVCFILKMICMKCFLVSGTNRNLQNGVASSTRRSRDEKYNRQAGSVCCQVPTLEPLFVKLLRSPGIDSQPGGPLRQPYLTYRRARLHWLAESIPWNRLLGSLKFTNSGLFIFVLSFWINFSSRIWIIGL
jgi:hypothetical protein